MIKLLRSLATAVCLLVFGIGAAAQAGFTFSPAAGGCSPLVVTFTNTSSSGYTSFAWSFGNSATSTLVNPSVSYTSPGTYTISMQASGTAGTQTVTKTITVYPPPVISFTATDVIGCAPLVTSFSSVVTPNATGRVRYRWDFGDGGTDTTANPKHTYLTGGVYSVTLTVTNGMGCTETVVQTRIVTVHPKPVSNFSATRNIICSIPAFAQFNASAGGTSPFTYRWDFGDGSPAGTGASPSHTYTSAGIYTVKLYTTDSKGCADTLVKQSYIETFPNTASFTGPVNGCDSSSVSFRNTTPGGAQAEWTFGDGSDPFYGDSAFHVYTRPGTYTVRMVTVVGRCSDTLTRQIVVHPKPVVTATHDIPCPPPTRMKFSGFSNIPGTTYTWAWTNGNMGGTGDTISRPYAANVYDTAVVIGTSPAGCHDTFRMEDVNVRDIVLEPDFRRTSDNTETPNGCIPLEIRWGVFVGTSLPCNLTMARIKPNCPYPLPVTAWHWVIDDIHVYNTARPLHTFTTVGQHKAVVTVTLANGCTATDTFYINAGDKIPPKFITTKDTACPGELVWFTNLTGIPTINYTWKFGEDDSATEQYTGRHKFKWPGSKTVHLYTEYSGCYDTLIKADEVFIRVGNAQFIDSVYCSPSRTVFLKDTSTGATSHLWVFGDGSPNQTTPSATHTYPAYGNYPVTKITHSTISGCRDTVVDTIRILPWILDLVATDTALCLGDTLHLTPVWNKDFVIKTWAIHVNTFTYGPGLGQSPPAPIDTVIMRPGYDTVRFLLVTRGGMCRDSITKNNYTIISHPVAGLRVTPQVSCMPVNVTFTDTSHYTPGTQPSSRWWSFGDGDTVLNNDRISYHYYDSAGLFTVKLRVTDWLGCTDSVEKRIVDVRKPIADFNTNNPNSCKGSLLTFNNLSAGATYLNVKWYFGDGDTSKVFHATHAYRDTGAFDVMLVVWDSTGCRDTLIRPAYIHITAPVARFGLSDTIAVCPPLTVQFNSTATGATRYAWDFGNTGTAASANPVSTFTTTGVYTVRLIAFDASGCPDTATAKVRVLGYAGALTYTAAQGCVPLTINFSSSIWNLPSLVWDFSDGVTLPATATNTSHTYLTPGKYLPRLIFGDGKGCTSSSDGLDTIRVDDIIGGFRALPPCEKTPLQLFDTSKSYFSPIVNSRWEFGSSGVMTGNPVTRSFPAAGDYPITLITTNGTGCKDTLSTTIRIHPLPKIVGNDDTAVCPPDMIELSVTGGKTYSWSPAAGLSCVNCANPQVSPGSASSWVVAGTDSLGCINRDTVKVAIQTRATFKVGGSGTICVGESYRLQAAGATLYTWTPGQDLDSPDTGSPLARPKATTTYVVTGREGSCAPDTHQVRVVVRPVPTVDAGMEQKVVAGNSVLLQASGIGIQRVSWETDASLSCQECFAPEARPKQTTIYHITAYNEYGCKATDSVRVLVLCDGSQLFLPNTFTPNGDGQNDFFYPQGVGIDRLNYFRIYSRWGELLYERQGMAINDEFIGWNGTHNGAKLNPDVYIYVLEARCDTGEPLVLKGDVTLIR